jgi:hypothetical protein
VKNKICKIALSTLIFISALSGCGKSKQELHIEELEKRIAATLTDPGSAQFRNVKLSQDQKYLCGEINGKNRLGGYVGFKDFAVSYNDDYIDDSDGPGLKVIAKATPKMLDDPAFEFIRKSGCFS